MSNFNKIGNCSLLILVSMLFLSSINVTSVKAINNDEDLVINPYLVAEMEAFRVQNNADSFSLSVVKGNESIWSVANGQIGSVNATPETAYRIGSITKTITAITILRLAEQGFLDINADINDYLDFEYINPDFPSTPTTLKMLLSHSAGIADRDLIFGIFRHTDESFLFYPDYISEFFTSGGIYYSTSNWNGRAPGESGDYCNIAFVLAGYIVEQVTNKSMQTVIDELISHPLNISSIVHNYTDLSNRTVAPPGSNSLSLTSPYNLSEVGTGALWASTSDLSILLSILMNGGVFNGVRILQEDSVNLLLSTVSGGYGLGWNTGLWQGKNGGIPGYTGHLYTREVAGVRWGYVILSNSETGLDFFIQSKVRSSILEGNLIVPSDYVPPIITTTTGSTTLNTSSEGTNHPLLSSFFSLIFLSYIMKKRYTVKR